MARGAIVPRCANSTEMFGSYPIPMTNRVALLCGVWLITACAGRHASEVGVWKTRTPLGPSLHFAEAVAPLTLAVLVLDAHSGTPIYGSPAIASSDAVVGSGKTDSSGVLRLRLKRAGRYGLHVFAIGYESWQGFVSVTDTSGFALVVQLTRSYQRPVEVNIQPEPARKPPNAW